MADNLNFAWGNTLNLLDVGAVPGNTAGSTFSTARATSAAINGKFTVPLAQQTNGATPTVDAGTNLPFNPMLPGMCCSLVYGVSSNGALQVVQGKIIACGGGTGATPGPLIIDPQFPGLPNDFCPLCYTVIRTAPTVAGGSWTPGTSAWATSGVAYTPFQGCCQLPNRPQAY